MSGVGPVEPGEGTRFREPVPPTRPQPGPLARLFARHRRAAPAALLVVVALAGSAYLYATRPRQAPPPPPPYPNQVTYFDYVKPQVTPHTTPHEDGTRTRGSFTFDVEMIVESGPPVTVTRISQPYAGVSLSSSPRPPFRTAAGSHRKITITLRVTECGKVPGGAGLPFLDVTLRNARAIQGHSFILGSQYAQDLSQALEVACSNDFR